MGFFATGLGTAVLLIGQSLLITGFVMISLLFLVYVRFPTSFLHSSSHE